MPLAVMVGDFLCFAENSQTMKNSFILTLMTLTTIMSLQDNPHPARIRSLGITMVLDSWKKLANNPNSYMTLHKGVFLFITSDAIKV